MDDKTKKKKFSVQKFLKDNFYLYGGILIAVLLFGVIFMVEIVPTGSMEPNYASGSVCVGLRLGAKDNIKRETPIFFVHDGIVMFKRVIGLPGETISLVDGYVEVNGERLDEKYIPEGVMTYPLSSNSTFTVPDGYYFVLGDNRADSLDSREWDNPYVSVESVKATALFGFKIPFWDKLVA